jgi:TetR/AcrR family transcriptional regulator, tetracycline repressor protein
VVKAKLSRQLILERALALADAEGLRAVTMRRLGSELGVEAMSLYHHVPNKEALLDGLVELVLEEARVMPPRPGWREHMTAHAHALRAAGHAHPRVMQLFSTRAVRSPAWAGAVEDTLAVLRGAGFGPQEAVHLYRLHATFVTGYVLWELRQADAPALDSYLDQLDPATYPATHELAGTLAATDPDEEFALGIEVLLAARLGR